MQAGQPTDTVPAPVWLMSWALFLPGAEEVS